jgi:hypothetical protein
MTPALVPADVTVARSEGASRLALRKPSAPVAPADCYVTAPRHIAYGGSRLPQFSASQPKRWLRPPAVKQAQSSRRGGMR